MKNLTTLFTGSFLLCLLGCGDSEPAGPQPTADVQTKQSGFETPEAAFEAFRTAASNKDYGKAIAALTTESQQALAGSLVFGLSMMAAFDEENGERITAHLEKHGITEETQESGSPEDTDENAGPAAMMRSIGALTNDPALFVAESIGLMDELADEAGTPDFADGTLSDVSIEGIKATGTLTTESGAKPIEFHKIDSGWLVHIPDEALGMGGAAGEGIDSEFSGFDDFDFHYDEEDELPPPDAISKGDYEAAWKTSVDFTDRTAADALTEMTRECGLKIFEQPEFSERLQQKVSVKLAGVSRLQVIEEICRQLDLHPRYKLKTLALGEGARTLPVAFAGPFLIAATELKEHVPHPTGRLEILFFAAGIAAETAAGIKNLSGVGSEDRAGQFTVAVNEITGGEQQLQRGGQGGYVTQASRSSVIFSRSYELKNLLQSVAAIDAIKGRISWEFPTEISVLKFDELKAGAVAESGNVKLTLKRSDLGDNSQFSVDIEGVNYESLDVLGRDSQGQALGNNFTSRFGSGTTGKLEMMTDGRPASLEARHVLQSERVTYEFQLESIPLPSHEEMPAQLTELSIDGDVPASFEVTAIGGDENFKELSVTVTNHTNKAIHAVELKMEYLDDSGKVLKDFPGSEQGDRVLVEAGQSADLSLVAFFMPKEATQAKVHLVSVEFADSTEWAAAK